MKRKLAIRTAVALTLVGLALLLPRAARAAQVEARVVDGDGAGVALTVSLEVHDGQQVVYQNDGLTDEDGVARWTDVPDSEALSARIRATYDGAEYVSGIVPLEKGAGSLELKVLPVVREGRPLHLDTLHLIVQADEPGMLRVLQFMTVSNAGEAAFAGGPQLADGRPAGVVIPLPAAATNVTPAPFPNPRDALDPQQAQVGSDRILDPRPVPGNGRQVAVTYELPLNEGDVDVNLLLPYPTQSVSLLLGGPGAQALTLKSGQLQAEPAEMIGDQQYALWIASALPPGTELRFTVAPPGISLTPGQIGLLCAGTGLLLAVAATLLGGGSSEYRAQQKESLIVAVAALDDSHAQGDISDVEYFRRRARELDRLALLDAGKGASERVSG